MSASAAERKSIPSRIPARLDRLSWSPSHAHRGRGARLRIDFRRPAGHDLGLGHRRAFQAGTSRHERAEVGLTASSTFPRVLSAPDTGKHQLASATPTPDGNAKGSKP
jgi:hypothetical protein